MDPELLRPELARLRAMLADDTQDELFGYLAAITRFALLELPTCVGISITVMDAGIPYTVTATGPGTRIADAAQYVDHGPCLATAVDGSVTDLPEIGQGQDPLWQESDVVDLGGAGGQRSSCAIASSTAATARIRAGSWPGETSTP